MTFILIAIIFLLLGEITRLEKENYKLKNKL